MELGRNSGGKAVALTLLLVLQLPEPGTPLSPLDHGLVNRDTRSISSGAVTNITLNPVAGSLLEALSNIESDTRILLANGTYRVENFTLVTGVSNICISGQGDVTITCSENIGLAFVNVSNLVIEGVRIEGCGLSGSYLDFTLNHIREFVDLWYVVYSEMKFAALLGHCENVIIDNVQVANNKGFGLVGINLIGSSTIRQLSAIGNTQHSNCLNTNSSIPALQSFTDPSRYGGGAVFLYQDYTPAYRADYSNSNNELTITNGLFMNNGECSYNYLQFFRLGNPVFIRNLGYRIGGGGGLTILVTQFDYPLRILTTDTRFENNLATMGGAAHVVFFSGVKNTQVEFNNCIFTQNGNQLSVHDPTNRILAGAALAVAIDNPRPDNEQITPPHVTHNLNSTIRIVSSHFTGNIASYGGGFYFYSAYTSAVSDLTDVLYVYVEQCIFERNSAFIGPGIQFVEYKYGAENVGTQLQIRDSDFVNNTVVTVDPGGTQSILQSAGVLDIRYTNVSLHGNCRIDSNTGTGLRAEVSYIGIAGNVTFKNNVGIRGGALHLQSYTYLIVLPNASLYLLDNTARVSGGAIYSNFLGLNTYLIGGQGDCFLYFNYDTINICDNCSDLNSTGSFIKFQGNVARSGGQIFGSAFQTCSWAFDLLTDLNLPFNTSVLELVAERFPNVIDIEVEGPLIDPLNFKTQAQTLQILDPTNTPVYDNNTSTYYTVPGQVFNVTAVAMDSYNQIISNVLSSFISTNLSTLFTSAVTTIGPNNFGVLQDNSPTQLSISLSGDEGQNVTVILYSTDPIGRALTQISVSLSYCGNGFIYNNITRRCECDPKLENLGVMCDTENQTLTVPDDRWVGPVDDTGVLGVGDCPLFYCSGRKVVNLIVNGRADFDVQCNSELFRGGILCDQCIEGRSFALGTPKCLECNNVHILLFPFFMILGVVLIFIIYYLDITISEGLLNGAIFFSNLAVLYALFLYPSNYGGSNIIFLISFLSLNFGIETCLYDGMGGLDRLWWQLSFPVYLVVLMIIIAILAHTKYFGFLHKTNRLSAVRAFTTLSLLCYVSVLQVCAELFGFTEILTTDGGRRISWITDSSITYFQGGHIPMLLIAVCLALFYILPFPFFLLFPSLIFKSKYLRKLKPFYDAYWNPFEPKFRFWLGFRLIFRWIPYLLTFLAPSPVNIFVTDSFLLVLLFVQLTLKPFKNWWINTIDSLLIYLLILMFTGTLYFEGEVDRDNGYLNERGVTIYNTIMIIIAFLLFCGFFYYHLYIRFSKVKYFSLMVWHKLSCKKGKYEPPKEEIKLPSNTERGSGSPQSTASTAMTESTSKPKAAPTHTIVSTVELREPLLEDDNVTSLTAPTRSTV